MAISNSLRKLLRSFKLSAENEGKFVNCIELPKKYDTALLWLKEKPVSFGIETKNRSSDFPEYIDIVSSELRPGKDPLHDQGYYYCLDCSSVFESLPLSKLNNNPRVIFDLCSSPGGKALLAWRALNPELLVCNEVIGKRIGQLKSNLNRTGVPGLVIQHDISILAERVPQTADLVIVDAPCSGQSLIVRGEDSSGCFLPHVIKHNAMRQRRILINAAQLVAPGGYLAYMTCTFSIEENEDNVEWLLKKEKDFEVVEIPELSHYRSHLSELPCYRVWPYQSLGAGGFTVLLKRKGEGESVNLDKLQVSLLCQQ